MFLKLPMLGVEGDLIIIIMKRISIAPIYYRRWEHRKLYNNTNNTHAHRHTHTRWWDRHSCEKDSLEIVIKLTL